MLESQIEREERKEVLRNDLRVKDQSNTMLGFTHDEVGGRFKEVASSNVIGTTAIPPYPAASGPWQGPDLVGDEPPLAFDALEPFSGNPAAQEAGEPTDAVGSPRNSLDPTSPATPLQRNVGSGDLTSAAPSTSPSGDVQRGVRLPPFRRFR
jgi:hypothetical protein